MRKPLQGIRNVIVFNWHYYVMSLGIILLILVFTRYLNPTAQVLLYSLCGLVLFSVVVSLLVTLYIYDFSSLYSLEWVDMVDDDITIVNIHAGFDETSALLKTKFPTATIHVFDFYNPKKHTEVSIERARKYFPFTNDSIAIDTAQLPLPNGAVSKLFLILAAHEIRDKEEQVIFFKEIHRVLKNDGAIYVTEHVRDIPNFFAYTIGCFHFFSQQHWLNVFQAAQLKMAKQIKTTPFITTYKLTKL
ncbi:MAG: methyltransferase domain-containing protein [Chitinophagales bacterium]|nr:methyltransferase domain-containing protein [Chitinophagales bacterium]